ncbi:MAG: Upf1 family helicase, partial [Candidatus Eremiobacteraeota bacterium]|nr:Upf1 family helicase [Candidatus Eremiobacteraeota bacterium]
IHTDKNYGLLRGLLSEPVTWLDTSDAVSEAEERKGAVDYGASNPYEVACIVELLRQVLSDQAFWDAHKNMTVSIGVICMYKAQRDRLRSLLPTAGIEPARLATVVIDTVDSYQGKENDIVIISLVRNNSSGRIGFLGDLRRINVAVSRARDRLVLVGSKAFFQKRVTTSTELRTIADFVDNNIDDGCVVVPSGAILRRHG